MKKHTKYNYSHSPPFQNDIATYGRRIFQTYALFHYYYNPDGHEKSYQDIYSALGKTCKHM
jgi:hypothetical protein